MKDVSNTRYGRLIAIKSTGIVNKSGSYIWECKCDCGNIKLVPLNLLTSNGTRSCGCIRPGSKIKDISGKKFNKLLVVKQVDKPEHRKKSTDTFYLCRCDCGREVITGACNLKKGHTKSCGCIIKESVSKRHWQGFEGISLSFYHKIMACAKRRNIDFNVSIEDIWNLFIKQNKKCALSGVDIIISGKGSKISCYFKDQTASLDRIDSNKPYTIDNIQWVHKDVNKMKQNFSEEEFLKWVRIIGQYNG